MRVRQSPALGSALRTVRPQSGEALKGANLLRSRPLSNTSTTTFLSMSHSFHTSRQRFDESLDQAESALGQVLELLDDLPSHVTNSTQARDVIDAQRSLREMLRTQQRRLEKL